jgi:RNA polymerase sigma factor (TIGR02999 family)
MMKIHNQSTCEEPWSIATYPSVERLDILKELGMGPPKLAIQPPMSAIHSILDAIDQGEPNAAEQLLPLVYTELRELAARKLAHESPANTLQPTALVHEAYLRIVNDGQGRRWHSRGHFFAAAAEAMRRILIEQARQKRSLRRGGGRQRLDLENIQLLDEATPEAVLALNEALERLAEGEPIVGQVVKLRFFAGLSIEETANALHISTRTVNRHWCFARAWLYQQLSERDGPGE